MNIALWILQGIAGAMYIMAGLMKSSQPKEKLALKMSWVNDYSAGAVKFIGLSQLFGGIGLIVPWATGILPVLTPIAGAALSLVMVLAAAYHIKKKEFKALGMNFFLFAMTTFIAYGRFMNL